MPELIILSGKGGTGKTSITAALASIFNSLVLADCDVDAADLHLLLQPQIIEQIEFWSGQTALLDSSKCNQCGLCRELCRFDAISANYLLDEIYCEGCGVCAAFCPTKAIKMSTNLAGELFISQTKFGPFIHAHLKTGEENSGKLVAEVRKKASQKAKKEHLSFVLIDGPPGIGCPAIASLSGAKYALIVTEPTLSGLHDLKRVIELTAHFQVKSFICINKTDINKKQAAAIKKYCAARDLKIVGQIPYDEMFTQAQIAGKNILEYAPNSEVSQAIKKMAEQLIKLTHEE